MLWINIAIIVSRAAEVFKELDSKVKKSFEGTAADISMFEIEPAIEKLEKLSTVTQEAEEAR